MKIVRIMTVVLAALLLSACAPRQIVKPIPADTPPEKVLDMAMARDQGLQGIRAMVKVVVRVDGAGSQSFDAVLYAKRPDRVRLTGLALMGYTVFDIVIRGEKFYFYDPSEGFLYTGPRGALPGFLAERGVKADPNVIFGSLFFETPGAGDRYFVDPVEDGYDLFIAHENDGVLVPLVKTEYDPGLNEKRRIFYDRLARPYLYVETPGYTVVDGYSLPSAIKVVDSANGYTVDVTFEKYLVNPDGLDGDFTIEGGEFKGLREVE
ncbi:MAG: hypothetical protein HZA22_11965 [Nitrospirae bacterium]|nr:hypothetical protein [Nitrospirota bacterium]